MRSMFCIGRLWILLLLPAVPVHASPLVSTLDANSFSLATIDPASGQVLSRTGVPIAAHPSDIASDLSKADGRIWAVTDDAFGAAGFELICVDLLNVAVVSRVPLNPQRKLVTLAIDPTDGAFYGTTTSELYRINPSTGALSLVGLTNLVVSRGLTSDLEGNLFGIGGSGNTLHRVDKSTGLAEAIFDLPAAHLGDIAVRPDDGVMFGVGLGDKYRLYTIDVANRTLTTIGVSVARPSGLAFSRVPEPLTASIALVFALILRMHRSRFLSSL
jgi:hypothetical protein